MQLARRIYVPHLDAGGLSSRSFWFVRGDMRCILVILLSFVSRDVRVGRRVDRLLMLGCRWIRCIISLRLILG